MRLVFVTALLVTAGIAGPASSGMVFDLPYLTFPDGSTASPQQPSPTVPVPVTRGN